MKQKYSLAITLFASFISSLSYAANSSPICPHSYMDNPVAKTVLPCRLPVISKGYYQNDIFITIDTEQNYFLLSNLTSTDTTIKVIYFTGCDSNHHSPESTVKDVAISGKGSKLVSFETNCTLKNAESRWPGKGYRLARVEFSAIPFDRDINVEISQG